MMFWKPQARPAMMRRYNRAAGRHPNRWQIRAEEDKHRHLLIVTGRRGGKTDEDASVALARAEEEGSPQWLVGATFDTAELPFGQCWVTARKFGLINAAESSYADGKLVLLDGGTIGRRSADSKRGNIGVRLRGLFCDEVCRWAHGQRVWSQDLRPTLSDYRGEAIWTTTASGWDFVHALHGRILSGQEPDWGFLQAPSWDNEYVFPLGRNDPEILAAEREYEAAGVPELFRQEYGAEFVVIEGLVLKKWDPRTMVVPHRVALDGVNQWWLGYDWGWDHSAVFALLGRTSGGLWRLLDESYGTGEAWEAILERGFDVVKRNGLGVDQIERLYYDPSRPEQGAGFRRAGFEASPAKPYDIPSRVLALGGVMSKPGGWLVSGDKCKRIPGEFSHYRLADNNDSTGKLRVVKVGDDGVDAVAGVLASVKLAEERGAGDESTGYAGQRPLPLRGYGHARR